MTMDSHSQQPARNSPNPNPQFGKARAFLMSQIDEASLPQIGDPVLEIAREGISAGIQGGTRIPISKDTLGPLAAAINQRVAAPGEPLFVQSDGRFSTGAPSDISGEWIAILREKGSADVTVNRYAFAHPGKIESLKLSFEAAMTLSTILRDVTPLVASMPIEAIAAAHGGRFYHGPARVLEMRNPVFRRAAPALEPVSLEDDLRIAENATKQEKDPENPVL